MKSACHIESASATSRIGIVAVARILEVSEITARKLADQGHISYVRDDAGRRKFNRDEVIRFAAVRNRKKAASA